MADNSLVNLDGTPEIPERTFHKWRHAVEDLFDINIECSRSMGGIYYIDHAEDMVQNGVRNLLVNAFAVNNLINNDHHLKRRIIFEQILGGYRFLIPLIEAMRDKKCVRISYRSFRSPETREIMLKPFCVKVFNRRWYLLAKNELNREPRLYALDRFEEMVTTDDMYCLPVDFDAEAYFPTAMASVLHRKISKSVSVCVSKPGRFRI